MFVTTRGFQETSAHHNLVASVSYSNAAEASVCFTGNSTPHVDESARVTRLASAAGVLPVRVVRPRGAGDAGRRSVAACSPEPRRACVPFSGRGAFQCAWSLAVGGYRALKWRETQQGGANDEQ